MGKCVDWYTDTNGFPEHSPSEGNTVLLGACPPEDNSGFEGGFPLYIS